MNWLRGLTAHLRDTVLRRKADRDMDEELRFHIEMETEKNIELGLHPREARRRALLAFGGVERHREALRSGRRIALLEDAVREARFAVRSLRRTPGMSLSIVAAIGLGIGVCTAIFSLAQAVVTRAVPFPEPNGLFSIELATQGGPASPMLAEYETWRTALPPPINLAAHVYGSRSIGTAAARVEAWSLRVTEGFFSILRPRLFVGRALVPSDASPGSPPVAIASERLWRELFGGDTAAVGSTVYVAGNPYTLVGVLAEGQEFPPIVDLWVPLVPGAGDPERGVGVIGRRQAHSPMVDVGRALRSLPAVAGHATTGRPEVLPLAGRDNPAVRPAFLLLWIAVGSILVIGIANAAGLMLTRSLVRENEAAVRTSLGASERRIAAGRLTESLLLASSATALGVVIAWLGLQALQRLIPPALSRQMLGWEQLGLNGRVLAFASLLALVAGAICGLVPRIGARRPALSQLLQGSPARATLSRRSTRALGTLVACEVALSLALLVWAGLLGRSLYDLMVLDPGFAVDDIVSVAWSLPEELLSGPETLEREQDRLLAAIDAWAGARPWSVSSSSPVAGAGFASTRAYRFPSSDPGHSEGRANWRAVSEGHLEMLEIPLLAGRTLTRQDTRSGPRVALVSEAFVARHWEQDEYPLGREVIVGDEAWSIVGVVGDVHPIRAGETVQPAIYVSQTQAPTDRGFLFVRGTGGLSTLRQDLWSALPDVTLGTASTLRQVIDEVRAGDRILPVLLGAYALAALWITLISLYAVVGHLVARHRREYGVRVALGASPSDVARRATWRGLKPAALGVLAGVGLAACLARLLASFFVDLRPAEPTVFVGVPLGVLLLLGLAAYVPGRRAARQEPGAILNG